MNEQSATRHIPAPLERVRAVLTTPTALPDWNPAIHTLTGSGPAEPGRRYPISARGGLRGHLDYTTVTERRIGHRIMVRGLEENGYWQLTPDGAGTVVEHGFSHRGPLARLLSRGFVGVAELRLDRLTERVRHYG